MFWDRFITLCNKINKKPNPVAADLGISSGSITKWKKGGIPSDANLKKIADYFGVSVECLKGKEELPTVNKKPPEIISNATSPLRKKIKPTLILWILIVFSFRCHAKFFKNFCKPLDMPHNVWYNIITR